MKKINQKWCIDFTYVFLKNQEVGYICTILILYDRSVITNITDRHIISEIAIRTLQKALSSQAAIKGEGDLHFNQGSQLTSRTFVEFCASAHITQSMSRAVCPYNNASMERYFRTLKTELIYRYDTEEALYHAIKEFTYIK